VARDTAFSFYYEDNLDLLRENGAKIVFFSPQADPDLPPGINGLYFGGGFPEMYAARLAANTSLKEAIRRAHTAGLPIYAECGGLMYLTEAIIDLDGRQHAMVGLLPGLTRMEPRLASLGYRLVESPTGNFLLPKGAQARGHEFHWSSWDRPEHLPAAWQIQSRQETGSPRPDGYAAGNLVASYVHLHFAHIPELAQNFVKACRT
jgi:cobyrinic acid a,c-diamide synthase